ncbi:MAG: dephospho-CoA kinase [Clostridia bacterium]|nr:dephospho-CoA kinase [Clostridia bacterium]
MSIRIIGVTGPTGAGKSFLCKALSERIPMIDADEVYHSLLIPPSECLDALRKTFGNDVFLPNGALDRTVLSEIVFSDKEKLTLLNGTVLHFVLNRIREMIADLEHSGNTCVLVDAPTLIESGFHIECDAVISVLSSPELRLSRIMTRDEISEEKASLRIAAQKDDDFYRAHSDLVLFNDGDTESLIRHATEFLATLDIHL